MASIDLVTSDPLDTHGEFQRVSSSSWPSKGANGLGQQLASSLKHSKAQVGGHYNKKHELGISLIVTRHGVRGSETCQRLLLFGSGHQIGLARFRRPDKVTAI